jgi:LDH2 family malate/lactate/ureidoglycolate dehydrogenase
MPRFAPSTLTDLTTNLLVAIGSTPASARLVAEHLVESNLTGHDSHGLIRLPQYTDAAADGYVNPSAEPEIVQERPTTAVVDGHFGWGPVVVAKAMEVVIAKAEQHDIAAVTVRRSYHVGRVGVYLEAAVRRGLIGQAFCNGHGMARAAPWGGTESRLATNPLAIAIPTRGEPFIADFATTAVAEGKVRLAKAKGERIPQGWVMGADGGPTEDPAVLYEGGTLLPLGGAQGHKGYCLSTAVDLLGGLLSGAWAGKMTGKYGNGLFIVVVNPLAFDTKEAFEDRIDEYLEYLRSSARKNGVDKILLPGSPERQTRALRLEQGVDVDADTWARIETLAKEHSVSLPAALD